MKQHKPQAKHDEYPFKDSILALVLDAEIKRIANEKGLCVGDVITKLSQKTGVSERQIYNYRSGKTDLQASHIAIFCKQFGSNALAFALLNECETKVEIPESFDLISIASKTARRTLKHHEMYLDAFDDGQIDGFELSQLEHSTASSIRDLQMLREIAVTSYEQTQVRQGIRR